jgi:exonuclease III
MEIKIWIHPQQSCGGRLQFSSIKNNRSSKKKVNKETLELNDTIDQIDLTEVCRVLHPATAQYTLFSTVHGISSKIEYILGHKASLNKYRKIEITHCILSDHNSIKLELNRKRNKRKSSNTWRFCSMISESSKK